MKKARKAPGTNGMLAEYDFRGGVRGKYAARYAAGTNVVLLSPDVRDVFPDSKSATDALRALADLIRKQGRGKRATT